MATRLFLRAHRGLSPSSFSSASSLRGSVRYGSHCCGTSVGDDASSPHKKNLHTKAYAFKDTEHPDIAQLLVQNKKWVQDSQNADPNFFKKIGGKQVPKYLYIGCSDSRVPANEILGLGPGEVFVHRNVGNLVIGSDINVLSVIEFAVQVLEVRHIIVTGHYDCGAVRAASAQQDLGLLENWIRNIRDVHRMHKDVIDALKTDEERHRCLVELSAVEQCYTLFKTGAVQRKRKETDLASGGKDIFPQVTAMVFDPKVGLLKTLPIDFEKSIEGYRHIYDLY